MNSKVFVNGLIEFSDTNMFLLPEEGDDEEALLAKLARSRREGDEEAEGMLLHALNEED